MKDDNAKLSLQQIPYQGSYLDGLILLDGKWWYGNRFDGYVEVNYKDDLVP